MKLWQKIFLTTLALVIVLVNVTSLIMLKSNHDLSLQREQQTAVTRHRYLITEITNYVVNTQLSERTVVLSDQRMQALFSEALGHQGTNDTGGARLYLEGQRIYPAEGATIAYEQQMLQEPDFSSVITRFEGRVLLLVVSSPEFNGLSYRLLTYYDITSTYQLFDATFNLIRVIGVVSALFVAGVLLVLVRVLLLPLRSLTSTTRQIASGDLQMRAVVAGNDEVAEVAENLNLMADSIQNSVTELEQLAESRKTFIGNLAHEMRTPLTSILGYADLLRVQREVSDLDRVEYAGIIVNETRRLQSLSGKLMELLSVGNMKLALEHIDLYELTDELSASLQPLFVARQMTLVCRISPARCVIEADRELLQSLIMNLVDNAMKASTEGSTITIATREYYREARSAAMNTISTHRERRIVVEVIDEGIGIAADQIPMLTEPFFMLDKARTRRHGGAGLGLALCAEIARAHGSELGIESQLGAGTIVSCDFAAVEETGYGTLLGSAGSSSLPNSLISSPNEVGNRPTDSESIEEKHHE